MQEKWKSEKRANTFSRYLYLAFWMDASMCVCALSCKNFVRFWRNAPSGHLLGEPFSVFYELCVRLRAFDVIRVKCSQTGGRVCVFVWFCVSGVSQAFWSETWQLPFTAPGGNKQFGRGSYLSLFIRAGGRGEGALLGSHCNCTQL